MQSKDHWERVYQTKSSENVSWYQAHAARSLRLIEETGVSAAAAVIDVGGGASTLVDDLLARGFEHLTVLDLSAAALAAAHKRLGDRARGVRWIEANITKAALPAHAYDVWHDRAVFHFLTEAADRQAYVRVLANAIKPGGHVIVATFAEDGPTECSGLPVMRYGPDELRCELGSRFELLRHEREAHRTPAGKTQHFLYCYFRRLSI